MKKLIEEIKRIDSSEKELRKFGFLFTIIFLTAGIYFYYINSHPNAWLIAGGFFLISSIVFPKILLPLHKVWMIIALLLGIISTRIILTVLFYFIITPIKIFIKKDLLDENIDKKRKSYWIKRETTIYDKKSTEQQY